jgi:hypothetical protein
MQELRPGVLWWTRAHPNHGMEVSSYLLADERVALNPLMPAGGREELGGALVEAVVLTNRHHLRDAPAFVEAFGAKVYAPAVGLDDLAGAGVEVQGYADGDVLPGGLVARQVGELSPDEFAVLAERVQAVAPADAVMRVGDGELGVPPAGLLGDDPGDVQRRIVEAYGRLLDAWEFEDLLLPHGDPVVGGAHELLRRFVESGGRQVAF